MADTLPLARRAVASPPWRWVPGMLDTDGRRVLRVAGGVPCRWAFVYAASEQLFGEEFDADDCREIWASLLPDLSDPATLGCVMALIREEWGQPAGIAALVAALEAHHA